MLFRSRSRVFLALFAITTLLLCGSAANAAAPLAKGQVPGYYRLPIGAFELTALSDGSLMMEVAKVLLEIPEAKLKAALDDSRRDFPKVRTAINAFLVNTGDKLILVDSGTGGAFGPTNGFLVDNLKAAGYTPDQIDLVLLTHLHPDHLGGLVSKDGKPVFPKATVMCAKDEADFWLSTERAAKAPEEARGTFANAQKTAGVYQAAGQWKTFDFGKELVPGVVPEAAVGHTAGHTAYRFASNGASILIIGDCIHVAGVQFAHPKVAITFDSDPKKAVETRLALFARVAREAMLVAGMHLPFPGIGHIKAIGEAFQWQPIDVFPGPDAGPSAPPATPGPAKDDGKDKTGY